MFVSSYTTFINTNSSNKTNKVKNDDNRGEIGSFSLTKNPPQTINSEIAETTFSKNLYSINFYRVKYFIESSTQDDNFKNLTKSLNRTKSYATLTDAQNAYENIQKPFVKLPKRVTVLDLTPKPIPTFNDETNSIKNKNLKSKMVNTYIENDNYYKVLYAS